MTPNHPAQTALTVERRTWFEVEAVRDSDMQLESSQGHGSLGMNRLLLSVDLGQKLRKSYRNRSCPALRAQGRCTTEPTIIIATTFTTTSTRTRSASLLRLGQYLGSLALSDEAQLETADADQGGRQHLHCKCRV